MAGNPQLNPTAYLSLDFTIPTGSSNSFSINSGASASPLIFASATPVNLGAQLEIQGTGVGMLFAYPGLTLTFKYFAENLETGAAVLWAQTTPPVPVGNGTLSGNTITYSSTVTQASAPANALPAGVYKITGIVVFPPIFAMNAYAEGPIVEVY